MSSTAEDSEVKQIVRDAIALAVNVAVVRTSHSWSTVVPSPDEQDSTLAVDTLVRLPSSLTDGGHDRHDASSSGTSRRSARSSTQEAGAGLASGTSAQTIIDRGAQGPTTTRAKARSVGEEDRRAGRARRSAEGGGAEGEGKDERHLTDEDEELTALVEVLEGQLRHLNTYKAKLEVENEAMRSWATQPVSSVPSFDLRPFGSRTDLLGAKLLEEQVKKYSLETLVPVLRESIGKLEQRLVQATTRVDKWILKYAHAENSAGKLLDIPLSIMDSKPAATLNVREPTPTVRILGGYMRQAIYDFQKERLSNKKLTRMQNRRVLRRADEAKSHIYILSNRMERLAHQAMRQRSEICYINKLNKASKKNAFGSQSVRHAPRVLQTECEQITQCDELIP
eukprot:GEMP01040896.1.p1 GENE.GEMP01040896.1~~GEMP01040896.1.p1  ORF type:complete len:395 (+),score=120.79 GEMP01040896.1:240-1424(+)